MSTTVVKWKCKVKTDSKKRQKSATRSMTVMFGWIWNNYQTPNPVLQCESRQHQEATATLDERWLAYLNQDHLTAAKQSPLSRAERVGQSGNTQTVRHSGGGLCGLWFRQLSFIFSLSEYCRVKKTSLHSLNFITAVAGQRPHLACRRSPSAAGELYPQIPSNTDETGWQTGTRWSSRWVFPEVHSQSFVLHSTSPL